MGTRERSEVEVAADGCQFLWAGVRGECGACEQGRQEGRREGCSGRLLPASGGRGLLGRRRQRPAIANGSGHSFSDRLKSCEDSRHLARYEKLFDDWWERRSRNAMKAGPARLEAIREPIGEVLPPRQSRRIPIGSAGE